VSQLGQRHKKRINQPGLTLILFLRLLNGFQQWRKNISHLIQSLHKGV
jgi:hypothetical protein